MLRWLIRPSQTLATVFRIAGKPSDEIEPLPARISAAALPVVNRLLDDGQRSVWRLMEELKPAIVALDKADALRLHNVNTLEEHAEVERLLRLDPRVATRD